MGKKIRLTKKQKAELLDGVCLHCGFFKMHEDKWPDWDRDGGNVDATAFDDLVNSATKIVADLFTMLDRLDQMKFMKNVFAMYNDMDGSENVTKH